MNRESSELWDATWIACPSTDQTAPDPAPILRTTFEVPTAVDSATLTVTAGGTAIAWINGNRVGPRGERAPATSDYDERVFVQTYDLGPEFTIGENVLALTLGRGKYAITTETIWGWANAPWHDSRPCVAARLELELADGTSLVVETDDEWRVVPGPTRFDSLYEGEWFDARERRPGWRLSGYDDTDWHTADTVEGPAGELVSQMVPSIRERRRLQPEMITDVCDGRYVVDFGEMIAGWISLEVDAAAGTELVIVQGEQIDDGGIVRLNDSHLVKEELQTDRYIARGTGVESWIPSYTYKGFRYAEVRVDDPENVAEWSLEAVVAHTPVNENCASDFRCGNSLLETIHDNTRRALVNNYHDVPTDTPVFEKNGWTGDGQLTATAALYDLSPAVFFRKWLGDIADSQLEDGEIPPIVPSPGWGYRDPAIDSAITAPNPGWDAAYPLLTWWVYTFTGDVSVLERHFDGIRALADYYAREYAEPGPGGIIDEGLGDWLPPHDRTSGMTAVEGPSITGTCYYYRMANTVADVATVLGNDEVAEEWNAVATATRDALTDSFFDADDGVYRTGKTDEYRQTSNVLPLAFGMVPAEHEATVAATLAENVRETWNGHLNTGVLGTRYLLDVLSDYGYVDLAFEVATKTTYPSWGHWIAEQDATALYEHWELDSRSRNHHMFGSIVDWFYRHLAGIEPTEPGFDAVDIAPVVPDSLPWVDATVDTPHGAVTVRWEQSADDEGDSTLFVDVHLPAAVTARVRVPGDNASAVTDGADRVAVEDGRTVFVVDGGDWSFETDLWG